MVVVVMDESKFLARLKERVPADKWPLVEEAYRFAAACHDGQTRVSGEPFIAHPIQTALFLADLRLDAATVAAGLLHDVIEDCGVTVQQIEEKFGPEIAKLVDGVTKLTRMDLMLTSDYDKASLRYTEEGHLHAESLRKMLVAMAEDVRVVLIKLADRLHNMRTLKALPLERQKAIAQETLDIYAPLAHRLGMWEMKWRLEDLAFRYLEPAKYRQISKRLAAKREEREAYIAKVVKVLEEELEKAGIKAEVKGRPKHIYSIYRKAQKYAQMGKELSDIYDLFAIRVLVRTKADCYNALGVVHNLWHPLPGQFDDYIANPKENMYQSLHTAVMCDGGVPLEVQIRTYEMDHVAEYGVAAHWRYKEGASRDMKFEEKMTWLRQLLEWQREMAGAEEFLESVKTDIFRDQVFVYTPKGDIKELPAGSTPLDFAYHIHTELGHRCIGAKVNGKLVSLDYQLKNGDTVEILTSKVARGPSLDWLNPHLGYVHTASARGKIRQWFRKQERANNIQRGKDLLHRELKRLGLTASEEDLARSFRFEAADEMYAALGSGGLTVGQVIAKLTPPEEEKTQDLTKAATPSAITTAGIQVLGVGDLLTRMARCCNPIPGDEIVGFITRGRGITVHKKGCPNIGKEDETERIVNVEWGTTKQLYPVRVEISAWDRVGLLRDISTQVSEEGVNIASVTTQEKADRTVSISLTLHTSGIDQLSRLFSKLEAVRGVFNVTRSAG